MAKRIVKQLRRTAIARSCGGIFSAVAFHTNSVQTSHASVGAMKSIQRVHFCHRFLRKPKPLGNERFFFVFIATRVDFCRQQMNRIVISGKGGFNLGWSNQRRNIRCHVFKMRSERAAKARCRFQHDFVSVRIRAHQNANHHADSRAFFAERRNLFQRKRTVFQLANHRKTDFFGAFLRKWRKHSAKITSCFV